MANAKISALTAVTTPALTSEVPVNEAGTTKKMTLTQIQALLGIQKKKLASAQSNSTTTPTKVTGLDLTLGAGTYKFEYFIRYRSSATTTGVRFDVNHSGTVTSFVWQQRMVDASATASTNAADQDQIIAAGGVMSAMASRAKGTAGRGTTISVDTANADMLMVIEGLCVVTVSGDLQLYHGSETANQTTVMENSVLIVTQVS